MNKGKKLLGLVLSSMILVSLGSCSTQAATSTTESNIYSNGGVTSTSFNIELTNSVINKEVDEEDYIEEYGEYTKINLNNSSFSVEGDGAVVSDSTLTINKPGTYVISGTLDNGQIMVNVNSNEKVKLVLDNASIHNESSAAIYVKNADKVTITLKEGTKNYLTSGETYVAIDENNIDGVIHSKDDLTINGSGELNITSNYKHGIVCKNDLTIINGTYNITSPSQSISGKDNIRILGGTFNLFSQGDGIKAKNEDESERGNIYIAGGEFNIDSVQDSLHATGSILIDNGSFNIKSGDDGIHSDKDVVVNNGTINIEESYEGIEGYRVTINNGDINIVSSDDSINAANPDSSTATTTTQDPTTTSTTTLGSTVEGATLNSDTPPTPPSDAGNTTPPTPPSDAGNTTHPEPPNRGGMDPSMENDTNAYIKINDGTLNISSGGDGLDSNGSIIINGGNLSISSPTNSPDSYIDQNGSIIINGGNIIGFGDNSVEKLTSTDLNQPVIVQSLSGTAGSEVTLVDSNGETIISQISPQDFNIVFISTPTLKLNETYTLKCGDSESSISLTELIMSNVQGNGFRGKGPRTN